jgi:hypothetical protein
MTTGTASAVLRRAWTSVTGETPDEKTVALLTAQWAHETGHGSSMYNYNFGGIKGTGPTGLSVEQQTKEGWGSSEQRITDRFRAYEDAESGAKDYVQLLTHRFPEAANAAKRGDAVGFVQGLKQRGYFTGDARAYQRSVSMISTGLIQADFKDDRDAGASQTSASMLGGSQIEPSVNAALSPRLAANDRGATTRSAAVAPLSPSVLMRALSSSASSPSEFRTAGDGDSLAGVSVLSMVDEVLRASLHLASTDNKANRRPGDVD